MLRLFWACLSIFDSVRRTGRQEIERDECDVQQRSATVVTVRPRAVSMWLLLLKEQFDIFNFAFLLRDEKTPLLCPSVEYEAAASHLN